MGITRDKIMIKLSPTIVEDCNSIIHSIFPTLEQLSHSTVLITGANGFLCSYIVDVIAHWNKNYPDKACTVVALDNLKTGLGNRLSHLKGRKDIQCIVHDISTPLHIDGNIDWVIHGASIASPTRYRQFPLETIDANAGGTRNILELAKEKQSKGVIVLSTSEIYGDPDPAHIPTQEDYRGNVSCTGPRACYDESKRLAETLCYIYFNYFNIPVKTIRPFNVFGPGQRLDDKRIIPDLMTAALKKEAFVLYSDGTATRSFCYVSDAVEALLKILVAPHTSGEAFNVGNDEIEISMRDLAQKMTEVTKKTLGWQSEVRFAKSQDKYYTTDNPQRRCPDLNKIKNAIDWVPKVSLEEGLTRTLQSYKELA